MGGSPRALVLGYGRSGKAAETLLKKRGHDVVVLDGEAKFPEGEFTLAIVSPGVPLSHPWIAECRARGIPFESELQFGCEELRRQGWKLFAVTGSKGKSSVVKIVADAINLAGMRGVPCGNYGLPVCEVVIGDSRSVVGDSRTTNHEPRTANYAVVEVSSFMMETTGLPADTFEAAAVLNLQEDHLDRHGSVEVYHALKRKLLDFTSNPIASAANCGDELKGSYFDNDILRANGAMAMELMRVAGLDDAIIRRAFAEFIPLPHRMNVIGVFDGVTYIDDSKATSLAALAAGVVMASQLETPKQPLSTYSLDLLSSPRIRLIAGGLPKGDDPKSVLSILTKRVEKVYLIGQCAKAFADAWKSSVDCEICSTMENAVAAIRREAVKGDKVLLSPGTASFDQFKSFGERGDVFARLVK